MWWISRLLRSGWGTFTYLIYLSPSVSSLLHCFSWVQKYELSYFFRVRGEGEREIERESESEREREVGVAKQDRGQREGRGKRERQWQYLWPTWVLLSFGQMKCLEAATHCSISQNIWTYTNFDTCIHALVPISKPQNTLCALHVIPELRISQMTINLFNSESSNTERGTGGSMPSGTKNWGLSNKFTKNYTGVSQH